MMNYLGLRSETERGSQRRGSYGDVVLSRRKSEPELKSNSLVEALGLERRLSLFSKPLLDSEDSKENPNEVLPNTLRANFLDSKRRVSSLKETRRRFHSPEQQTKPNGPPPNNNCPRAPEFRSPPRRKSHSVDAQYMLESAIANDSQRLVAGLLRSGQVNVNKLNEAGLAMIHYAAFEGRTECLKLLLKHGAYVNLVDRSGVTALEIAVFEGQFDCASVLLASGADDALIRDGYYDRNISHPQKTPPK